MELYHGSHEKNLKIVENGNFGEFLFFSGSEINAASHGDYLYKIEIDENDLITPWEMFYGCTYENDESDKLQEIAKLVTKKCKCDIDTAYDLLAEKAHVEIDEEFNHIRQDKKGELGLFIQAQTAQCCKVLGFSGVKVIDEHGGSYMINMIYKGIELINED